jgi:hypothetical protein
MLAHLASLVKPGGKLLIADFIVPSGNQLARASQTLYWGVTNLFYYLLRLCAWHSIYDYPQYFTAAGLTFQKIERFRVGRFGPQGFCAITAVRCLEKAVDDSQTQRTLDGFVARYAILEPRVVARCP